jgi:AraC-like DNA-binding protein
VVTAADSLSVPGGETVDTVLARGVVADTVGAVVADTAVDTSVGMASVDTSVSAAIDTSVDTLANVPVVDTPPTVVPAAEVSGGSDTVPRPVVVDTVAAEVYSSLFTADFDDSPPAAAGGLDAGDDRELPVNVSRILFWAASLIVIVVTLFFFLRRKDAKRFLTTTRLSVLDRMVQKGCRYIESNYADPALSVSSVCRELVTGEAYLDALFVKEIGINVQDFILQVRVNNLKILLRANPSQDLQRACTQCGFADRAAAERHFVRLVKRGIEEYAADRAVARGD